MKLINKIILSLVFVSLFACADKEIRVANSMNEQVDLQQQLPRVLFITTGINTEQEDKDLPKGVIVALHTFNTLGIPVRLEPRDVLFDYDFLMQFNLIILPTAKTYHDADRMYSLTYMTDEELNVLKKYVQNGGIILAGDNLGRNYFDGTDRILKNNRLDTDNYPLAEVFGWTMVEKNMQNYRITGNINHDLQGELLTATNDENWVLIPQKPLSKQVEIWAYWKNNKDSIPALTLNRFGKGYACLLPSSDFIHPVSAGGAWSVAQITSFYRSIIRSFFDDAIQVNPWIKNYQSALALSFNTSGNSGDKSDYKRLFDFLKKEKLPATFFVNGNLNDTLTSYLLNQKPSLSSTGYEYLNFIYADYATAVNDILRNNSRWKQKFTGFRFPYTNPSFEGLVALSQHGFSYESSLSANNIEFLQGSVVPYNLVFAKKDYYQSTQILELSPTYHDDYYFLQDLREGGYAHPRDFDKDVLLLKEYLINYWQYAVRPHKGVMIYLGHPDLTAHNEQTLTVLKKLADSLRKSNVWIAGMNEIKNFRDFFNNAKLIVKRNSGKFSVEIKAPNRTKVKDFSLKLNFKPHEINIKNGGFSVVEQANSYFLIFDAFDGQKIIFYK